MTLQTKKFCYERETFRGNGMIFMITKATP